MFDLADASAYSVAFGGADRVHVMVPTCCPGVDTKLHLPARSGLDKRLQKDHVRLIVLPDTDSPSAQRQRGV